MSDRWYGLCPTQLEGITSRGEPFYFRSRGGSWTLRTGPAGEVPNYCAWSSDGELTASGLGDIEDPDAVDAIVTEHLGGGWRHVTYEEQLYPCRCLECGKVFKADGSNVCISCLAAQLGFR